MRITVLFSSMSSIGLEFWNLCNKAVYVFNWYEILAKVVCSCTRPLAIGFKRTPNKPRKISFLLKSIIKIWPLLA